MAYALSGPARNAEKVAALGPDLPTVECTVTLSHSKTSEHRLMVVRQTIERQKAYIGRVPDPDNRDRADANLQTLVAMRDDLEAELGVVVPGR